MEYFFKMLTNIKVDSAYLHKTNCVVSGLYRRGSLVGGLLPAGSQLDLLEYLKFLYDIFPDQKSNFPLYHCINPTITYANDGWGKFLINEELRVTNDESDPHGKKAYCISKPLLCIEPIITHFKKSNAYIAALYWHQHLVGVCAISGVTKLKDFVPYLYTVYPKDINELETFVEKNTAIEYYYNDEMIISKLTINK